MPKTLRCLADLATAPTLPRKPSFADARARRLAEEAEVLRQCAENRRREEEREDLKPSHRSRFSQVSSVYTRTHEKLIPINKQTIKGLSLDTKPDDGGTDGSEPSPSA